MRSRCGPPIPSFDLEVLDGNDIPERWVGRQVGVETVSSLGITAGWLQSKSAWRLVVVDDRTGEARCIPWVDVEAVSLLEEEPEAQTARREAERVPRLDRATHDPTAEGCQRPTSGSWGGRWRRWCGS